MARPVGRTAMKKSRSNPPIVLAVGDVELRAFYSKLKWRQLTEGQKRSLVAKGVLNGCGGGKLHWLVPNFRFRACCDQHDYHYWLGGSKTDRAKADWQFFTAMLADADRLLGLQAWTHITLSIIYYVAVRLFGWSFWRKG